MFKSTNESPAKQKLTVSIDYRIISVLLVLALATCLYLWKPWDGITDASRQITVNGTATVKGVPDEYQMTPYFEFKGDRTTATAEANKMASEVSAKLKEIGVKDTEIKSSTSSYDKYTYAADTPTTEDALTLSYIITVVSKDTAQKVQDYFLNTAAKGQISPFATFSQAKQKELEAQARQNAIDDAKAKAKKSAEQIEAKIGKVVKISDDGTSSVQPYMMSAEGGVALDVAKSSASIAVQPGQNDFSSSVQIVYELR